MKQSDEKKRFWIKSGDRCAWAWCHEVIVWKREKKNWKNQRQSYQSGLHIIFFFCVGVCVCVWMHEAYKNDEYKKKASSWCYFLCTVLYNANNSNLCPHNVISFSMLFIIKCNMPLCPWVLSPSRINRDR